MTTPAEKYAAKQPVTTDLAGQTLVCLRTLTEENPAALSTYLKIGGYATLKKSSQKKLKPLTLSHK